MRTEKAGRETWKIFRATSGALEVTVTQSAGLVAQFPKNGL